MPQPTYKSTVPYPCVWDDGTSAGVLPVGPLVRLGASDNYVHAQVKFHFVNGVGTLWAYVQALVWDGGPNLSVGPLVRLSGIPTFSQNTPLFHSLTIAPLSDTQAHVYFSHPNGLYVQEVTHAGSAPDITLGSVYTPTLTHPFTISGQRRGASVFHATTGRVMLMQIHLGTLQDGNIALSEYQSTMGACVKVGTSLTTTTGTAQGTHHTTGSYLNSLHNILTWPTVRSAEHGIAAISMELLDPKYHLKMQAWGRPDADTVPVRYVDTLVASHVDDSTYSVPWVTKVDVLRNDLPEVQRGTFWFGALQNNDGSYRNTKIYFQSGSDNTAVLDWHTTPDVRLRFFFLYMARSNLVAIAGEGTGGSVIELLNDSTDTTYAKTLGSSVVSEETPDGYNLVDTTYLSSAPSHSGQDYALTIWFSGLRLVWRESPLQLPAVPVLKYTGRRIDHL